MADSRTRITIETERTVVVARRQTAHGSGRGCGREAEVSMSEQAGRLLDARIEQAGRLLDARILTEGQHPSALHLHWVKDVLGVCLKSLQALVQSKRERPGP
jgi:hypothetical protein